MYYSQIRHRLSSVSLKQMPLHKALKLLIFLFFYPIYGKHLALVLISLQLDLAIPQQNLSTPHSASLSASLSDAATRIAAGPCERRGTLPEFLGAAEGLAGLFLAMLS